MRRILALSAMLFLLLRPLCDVQAAGVPHDEPGAYARTTGVHHAHEALPCCSSLEDGSLVTLGVPSVALDSGNGQPALAAPVLLAAHDAGGTAAVTLLPPDVLPPSLSFYARSARIRR